MVFSYNHTNRGEDDEVRPTRIHWKVGRWTEGIHEDENGPQDVVDLCRPDCFEMREIDSRSVYFTAGPNDYQLITPIGEMIDSVYYQLFTNYNTEFDSPDSLTLIKRIDWPQYNDTTNICRYNTIETSTGMENLNGYNHGGIRSLKTRL